MAGSSSSSTTSNEYFSDICDKLLGIHRNDPLSMKITKGVKYNDPYVCRNFLVGFCPHLVFANTKSDIGPCSKKFHDESLKEQFKAECDPKVQQQYELAFFDTLHAIIVELGRKIKKAQHRLDAKASEEVEQLLNPEKDEYQEKRAVLEVQMKNLITKMEEFGEQGKIKQVQEINLQLDMLKAEMARLRQAEESNPLVKQDKKMEVCQVCASFLIMNDIQKRLEAHFEGKQHVGYQQVWESYEALKLKYPDYHYKLEHGKWSSSYRSSGDTGGGGEYRNGVVSREKRPSSSSYRHHSTSSRHGHHHSHHDYYYDGNDIDDRRSKSYRTTSDDHHSYHSRY